MQIRVHGSRDEIAAMREWLPSLFWAVRQVRVYKDRTGPGYQLVADVQPTQP